MQGSGYHQYLRLLKFRVKHLPDTPIFLIQKYFSILFLQEIENQDEVFLKGGTFSCGVYTWFPLKGNQNIYHCMLQLQKNYELPKIHQLPLRILLLCIDRLK